jgi:fermentation-respiration switch protein FrsA (DUF1100 family)
VASDKLIITRRTTLRAALRRRLIGAAVAVIALLMAAYIGIGGYAALTLTTPVRAFDAAVVPPGGAQDVVFPARGGDVRIAGWYLPQASTERAIILVHGRNSSRTSEFGGEFPEFAAALQQRGFAVLMIDLRGHGASGDAHQSFGLNERRDVLGALDWLLAQGFAPGRIGVLGVSMGGAAALGAAAETDAIGAVVSDSSYAAILPIIEEAWPAASGLPDAFLPVTLVMGEILLGYDLSAARPVDDLVRVAARPVLLIHGDQDQLIPLDDAYELQHAAPQAELWVLPGVQHARAYGSASQAYQERIAAFFEQALP